VVIPRHLVLVALIGLGLLTACGNGNGAEAQMTASVELPGGLTISDAAVTEGDRIAAGYMVISASQSADRLVAASSPAAARIIVHSTSTGGSMQPVQGRAVGSDSSLSLVPGGDHLMLEGLAEPLVPGSSIALDLTFEVAGEVRLQVPVVALVDVLDVYDRGW
jgi:periplasmic copper chaperone A